MISSEKTDLEQGVLGLQPREYILGIGCRRGKSFEELDAFIQKWLDHEMCIRDRYRYERRQVGN